MRPTLTLLSGWNTAELRASADALTVTGCRIRAEVEAGCQRVRGTDWSGTAGDAARDRAGHELASATTLAENMDRIATELRSGAAALAAARTAVFDVVDDARAMGLVVGDRGRVGAPPPGSIGVTPAAMVVWVALDALARVHQNRLSAALDTVEGADRDLAAALRRVESTGLDDTDDSPAPRGLTPDQNARYWSTLSPEQRRDVVEAHPEWVGNLDGLPMSVRDTANRSLLDADRRALEERIARISDDPDRRGGAGSRTRVEVTAARDRLAELDALARAVADPDRRLLVYRNADELRAAVAAGDVDTADHVAVFTPGLGSTVGDDMERYANDVAALGRDAAGQLAGVGRGDETVATVTWLDYLPPEGDLTNAVGLAADLPAGTSAIVGGAALSEFYRGVSVSRPDGVHLSALGHSYGSTTTGLALQRRGGLVDDAVFFGSPGLATRDVRDLGVPPGHVFVAEAAGDRVADAGVYGTDPNRMTGVTNLSTAAAGDLSGSTGHSSYLTPGSTSMHNIAAVVAGIPEHTIGGTDAGLGDSLPAGIGDSLRGFLFGDPRDRWLDEIPRPATGATR